MIHVIFVHFSHHFTKIGFCWSCITSYAFDNWSRIKVLMDTGIQGMKKQFIKLREIGKYKNYMEHAIYSEGQNCSSVQWFVLITVYLGSRMSWQLILFSLLCLPFFFLVYFTLSHMTLLSHVSLSSHVTKAHDQSQHHGLFLLCTWVTMALLVFLLFLYYDSLLQTL